MSPKFGSELSVLIVGSLDADFAYLLRILSETNWNQCWCSTSAEAMTYLKCQTIPIAICNRTMRDAAWKDLLHDLNSLSRPPSLIVAARTADDRLWADVLNEGGYDLLLVPFDK